MNIEKLIPHYIVREAAASCNCHIDDTCDCMPSLYVSNGQVNGYGSAHWTYTDESCPVSVAYCGMAYWCSFLGFAPFWATGEMDAAEKLSSILDNMGIAAKVNFRHNKKAEEFLAEGKK